MWIKNGYATLSRYDADDEDDDGVHVQLTWKN